MSADAMRQDHAGREGLTGRHVLMILVGFFGIVMLVNAYFLYSALSTHTGVVAQEPYRKGLKYNDRIAADERQQALGWSESLLVSAGRDEIVLDLKSKDGIPVRGLKVEGVIGRPSTGEQDVRLALAEQPDGTYAARIKPLDQGTWLAHLEISELTSGGDNTVYRLRKRLWLKP